MTVPYAGLVVTAFAVSVGSNVVHDLLGTVSATKGLVVAYAKAKRATS